MLDLKARGVAFRTSSPCAMSTSAWTSTATESWSRRRWPEREGREGFLAHGEGLEGRHRRSQARHRRRKKRDPLIEKLEMERLEISLQTNI